MKNEITIYELLGRIKDGNAPKKIKYEDDIFYLCKYDYSCENNTFIERYDTNYLLCFLFELPENVLNKKVEVIEEHKHTIEKLNIESENNINFYIKNEFGTKCCLTKHSKIIAEKLNEIIDYIQEKENK